MGRIDPPEYFWSGAPLWVGQPHPGSDFTSKLKIHVLLLFKAWGVGASTPTGWPPDQKYSGRSILPINGSHQPSFVKFRHFRVLFNFCPMCGSSVKTCVAFERLCMIISDKLLQFQHLWHTKIGLQYKWKVLKSPPFLKMVQLLTLFSYNLHLHT